MNHTPDAGSITPPVDLQSRLLHYAVAAPAFYTCPQYKTHWYIASTKYHDHIQFLWMNDWMIGVLGYDSALLRLYWARDNLGPFLCTKTTNSNWVFSSNGRKQTVFFSLSCANRANEFPVDCSIQLSFCACLLTHLISVTMMTMVRRYR